MQRERLRDSNEDWGLSPAEYARREKIRMREKMKKRAQRERLKMQAPPLICEYPVGKFRIERLKGEDIQELGIMAVTGTRKEYSQYIHGRREFVDTAVSLPFVSILYGEH